MTTDEVLARARRAIGHHVIYYLGEGGLDPAAPFPFKAPEKGCDCSGFAMWALGLSRVQDGIWYGTDMIAADALSDGGLFDAVPLAQTRIGDLLCYAHLRPGHHGHVGMVSRVDGGGPTHAIHCSMGNWHVSQDAIQETGVGLWTLVPTTVVARLKSLGVPG